MVIDGRANEDAAIGRRGRPFRDYVYLMTSGQNFDHLSWFDAARSTRGWFAVLAVFLCWLVSVPLVIWVIPFLVATYSFGVRVWFLSPLNREEGARHVLVLFEADGYWHRAEFIRGRGEVVKVLTDGNGPVPASTASHVLEAIAGVDWGDQATDDQPRHITRALKTYRRRPSGWRPFEIYPRTSVGFASHVLGIHSAKIRSPQDLMAYCERDALDVERVDAQLQAA